METTKEQKQHWLEQMENDIIPFVARLIEKEKAHNEFLKNAKQELESRKGFWHLPWKAETDIAIKDIYEMIRYSDSMLEHFETRHKEYIEFVEREKTKQ